MADQTRRSRPPLAPTIGSQLASSPTKRWCDHLSSFGSRASRTSSSASTYPAAPPASLPPPGENASSGGLASSSTLEQSLELEPLAGVPSALQAWWHRTQPGAFDQETYETGRIESLKRIGQMLGSEDFVVDLGCGTGLLAKVSGRRDVLGVEMAAGMIKAARASMEEVVQENILEYHPLELADVVVLNNVLEPYAKDVRALILQHCYDFLRPGGKVIVGIALGTGSSVDSLAFPSPISGPDAATPEGLEEELTLAGFDPDCPELLSVQPAAGEESQSDLGLAKKRSYMLLVGRKPAD